MPLRHGYGPEWSEPFERLRRFQDEMGRRTGAPGLDRISEYPPVNVWTGEHDVVITAEVPGVDPDDIELTVHQNALTLKGRRRSENGTTEATFHRRERSYGAFGRTLTLPFEADASKVQADFDAGILKIYVPRPEAEKPRRISISKA